MGRNKVLMVSPRTGFDALKPQMPSAMVYLGTNLKKAGYDPIVVDQRVDADYKEQIKNNIGESLAVCLTAMTGTQILFGLGLAKYARSLDPTVPIIWGGVHPSIFPKQTIKNEFVDIIVKGEGDNILVDLINNIKNGEPYYEMKSIVTIHEGIIHDNPEQRLLDVKELPDPDWDLIDTTKYRIFDVQSARGCPHRCAFCYNKIFNQAKWRRRSSECIVEEIEALKNKFGIDEVNFIDDNFFTDKKRSIEMMNLMIERNLNVDWRVNCRADYFDWFDEEFLLLAQKSGLKEVLIGCESGSQKILDYIQKDCTVEQIRNAIRKCAKYGIQAQCSFMMGFPIETKEDNLRTFQLIDELREIDPNVLITAISIYTPYPGSPLFEVSKEYGFDPPQTLEDWGDFTYTFVNVPWLKGMEKAKYESISYITRFLFFGEKLEQRFITPALWVPFKIMKANAKLRWKYRFFALPLEWMLVKSYLVNKRKKELAHVMTV